MSKARLLLAAVCCLTVSSVTGLHHIVGGRVGWSVPPNMTYFEDWAKHRAFGVGDQLLFPFTMPLHNLVEVGTKDDFEHCTQNNLIDIYTRGPYMINYTAPGDHYYYSGIGKQCEFGLKLHVTVVTNEGSSGRILPPPVTPTAPLVTPTAADTKQSTPATVQTIPQPAA